MKHIFVSLIVILITQPLLADMSCDTNVHKYFAVYEINTYDCAPGYYLPANTDGCRVCPTGFNCPGGTFDFDPDLYQGLSFESVPDATMNNICATNFPKKMFAVYEPNTVNLTWNDGAGNTVSTTCTYDGLINLPPEPAQRPGYRFNGWKLAPNQ